MATTEDLNKKLKSLTSRAGPSTWHPVKPCPESQLAKIERQLHLALPKTYRAILLAFGGGMLQGPAGQISLTSWQQIVDENEDPFYEELSGTLIIGGDGGGNTYFVDVEDRLGFGVEAIFIVSDTEVEFAQARYLAGSIAELFDQFLARDTYWNFFDNPAIGQRG